MGKKHIDNVVSGLKEEAEDEKADAKALNANKADRLTNDAENLKDLTSELPTTGMTDDNIDYKIRIEVEKIMKDLAHEPTLNPATVTEKELRSMNIDSDV